jgi:hypothetical protein
LRVVTRGREIVEAGERGDLDAVLALTSPEEIADAWWRYVVRCHVAHERGEVEPGWDSDPDAWASELWMEGVIQRDEQAFRTLLRTFADRAPGESLLVYLGAGPIEDFLTEDEDRLRWIEEEAKRSRSFRLALASVWIEWLGAPTFLRIQEAAGTDLVWHVNYGPRPLRDGSFVDPDRGRSMR